MLLGERRSSRCRDSRAMYVETLTHVCRSLRLSVAIVVVLAIPVHASVAIKIFFCLGLDTHERDGFH